MADSDAQVAVSGMVSTSASSVALAELVLDVPLAPVGTSDAPIFSRINPDSLVLASKPTGMNRMGHLMKLDIDEDMSEESWIKQYVEFDIEKGMFIFFAELGGRRIRRGCFEVRKSDVNVIEHEYFGRLFTFKLFPKDEEEETDENTAVYAAENLEVTNGLFLVFLCSLLYMRFFINSPMHAHTVAQLLVDILLRVFRHAGVPGAATPTGAGEPQRQRRGSHQARRSLSVHFSSRV